MIAMQELVVPRSMPRTRLIVPRRLATRVPLFIDFSLTAVFQRLIFLTAPKRLRRGAQMRATVSQLRATSSAKRPADGTGGVNIRLDPRRPSSRSAIYDTIASPCLPYLIATCFATMIASRCFAYASAALTVVTLVGCVPETRVRHQDALVKVTEKSTVNLLNVHASSDTATLTIWGQEFKEVRGRNPCYLPIPNSPLILFVTGRTFDGGQAVVHIANTSTHKTVSFPAYDSHIGSEIGEPTKDRFERVASVEGDKLIIEAGFLDARYKYFIDVSKPKFERQEADFVDSASGKTTHYVYEEGKLPKL
jgi:hypothetical protein